MPILRSFLFPLLLLFSNSLLYSQEYLIDIQKFSVEDGLSSRFINSYFKSQDGFMWLATRQGVNRFDGKNFKVFLNDEKYRFSNNCISLLQDDNENIWIRQLDVFNEKIDWRYLIINSNEVKTIDEFFGAKMPFKSDDIFHVEKVKNGPLIITTNMGELYWYDGQFKLWSKEKDLQKAYLHPKLYHQNFLFLTETELLTVNKNGTIINRSVRPRDYLYPSILEGSFMWYTSYFNRNFYKVFTKLSQKHPLHPIFYQMDTIKKWMDDQSTYHYWFTEEEKEPLFLIYNQDKFLLFNSKEETIYDFSDHLFKVSKSQINGGGVFFDHRQIWISSNEGFSIINYKQNPFQQYLQYKNQYSVRGIKSLDNGNLLVATYEGVKELNPDKNIVNNWTINDYPHFRESIEDKKGHFFFGAYGSQIEYYNHNTKSHKAIELTFKDKKAFDGTGFLIPFKDQQDNILVGTSTGLIKYNRLLDSLEVYQKYNGHNRLKNAVVMHVQEHDDGIWITSSDGLYTLDSKKGITEEYHPVPNTEILHFYREGSNFWLGTYGKGLLKWNKISNKIEQFTVKQGLPDNIIMAIYPDQNQNLWLTSNKGLIRFNKNTYEIHTYLESDGITHEEFNISSHYQDKDGRLYFGGLNGVTAFHPDQISIKQHSDYPLVVMEYSEFNATSGFSDNTNEFLETHKIQLAPSIKSFTMKFAFLNFENANKTRYAYKIEGYTNHWIEQDENYIRINNLPFGDYNLKIKAKSYNGQWSENELAIPIHIITPFYAQRAWQFLGLALLGLIIFLGIKWRINAIEKEKILLEQVVTERTQTVEEQKKELNNLLDTKNRLFAILAHDLRNPVIAFEELTESMNYLIQNNEPERMKKLGNYIETEAKQLHHLLDNLLNWALAQREELLVTITAVPLASLVDKVLASYQHFKNHTSVQLSNSISEEIMVMGDRRILETVLRNLISNAFRYTSKKGWIKITCQETPNTIVINVADNGKGMTDKEVAGLFQIQSPKKKEEEMVTVSLGLHLCRELIELLNGHISVISKESLGTTFSIELPKGN